MAIVRYLWDFGDGLWSNEATPSHTYTVAGTYNWTVTAWTDGGLELTDNGTIVVTAPATLQRTTKTLRFAMNPRQGRGWSECTGADWVDPKANGGPIAAIDINDNSRMLIEDRSDDSTWEEATFDGITDQAPSYTDKDDGGGGTEISSEKWFKELMYGKYPMEHLLSIFGTRPQRAENKGKSGYDSNGYRLAQEFDLDVYVNGDQTRSFGSVSDIPEEGDIHFGGLKVSGTRFQFVFKTATSEFMVTENKHNVLVKTKQGTRAQRTMDSTTNALLLSAPVYHISRGLDLLYERVSQETIAGSVTAITGPDGRDRSAMRFAAITSLANPAVAGAYTIMYWRKNTGNIATIPGLGAWTQVGDTFSNWQLWTNQGVGLAANLKINKGDAFDIWIFNADVSDAFTAYYNDVRYNAGRVYMPSF